MFTFIKDKNGWLSWERWTGFKNNVFCPFNKKMQCNAFCPMFCSLPDEESTEKDAGKILFLCPGNASIEIKNAFLYFDR